MGCLQADIGGCGINVMRWYQKTGPGVYWLFGSRTGILPEIIRGVEWVGRVQIDLCVMARPGSPRQKFTVSRVAHDPVLPKYTARPPCIPNGFWPDFCIRLSDFTTGSEREMRGRNAWGGEGGSGGVLWLGRRVPGDHGL